MKKLLSLLSVLTISGTAVPTTIAASSYEKEENNNYKENLSSTIKGYFIYTYSEKFLKGEEINLTELFGYNNWDEFKKVYKSFEFKDIFIQFSRENPTIVTTRTPNCKIYFSDMDFFNDYGDLGSVFGRVDGDVKLSVGISGAGSFSGASKNQNLFLGVGENKNRAIEIFNEKIDYKVTYHKAKVSFSLKFYKKNNNLFLQPIYRVWLETAGSTEKGILYIITSGYKFSKS